MARSREIIPYRYDLVAKAKSLRKNSTPGEIELWKALKGKQMLGFDFDRQKPIHHYIVDFFCKELKLAIEIDGDSHSFKVNYDKKREKILNNLGVNILRFTEEDARINTDHCILEIKNWIKRNPPLSPPKERNSFTQNGAPKRFY